MPLPLLKAGLHPKASDAFRKSGIEPWRIGQTVGAAKASAGTHESDGEVNGEDYCAATDIRVRDLTHGEMRKLLSDLADQGFAGFARIPGRDGWPKTEMLHLHVIYAGVPMKKALRDQVHDWCNGRNGLRSHAPYKFWQPTNEQEQIVRTLFLANNPATG